MVKRMSPLAAAAASGDRLALLRELPGRLVDAIDGVTCVRDLEPLTRRLDVISKEIDDLAAMREPSGSPADILPERREQRFRRGEAVSVDHAAARATKLHG